MKLNRKYAVLQIQDDGVNHQVIQTFDELADAVFQMQMGIDLELVQVLKTDYVPTEAERAINLINKERK